MTTPRRPGSRGGSSAVITAIVRALAPRLPSTMRPGRRAEAGAPHGVADQIDQASRPARASTTPARRRCRAGTRPNLGEVVHVRAEHDGLAEHRRLEDVVAAGVDQAAADEDHAGDLVEPRQLADGVEDDDVGVGATDRRAGSVRRDDAEAFLGGEPRHFLEALRMARRDDQQRVRPARLDAAEGLESAPGPRRAACWRQSPPGGPATRGSSAARDRGSGRAGRRRASRANRTSGCR